MAKVHYFAYGSNLHPARLTARVPSARLLCVAYLSAYDLRFHKRGRDGSGKCNIHYTGSSKDRVIGAVYVLNRDEKEVLDDVERGYRAEELAVIGPSRPIAVFAYIAEAAHIDDRLLPFTWYKWLVVEGARHHALPLAYRSAIESVAAEWDPKPDRARDALAPFGGDRIRGLDRRRLHGPAAEGSG